MNKCNILKISEWLLVSLAPIFASCDSEPDLRTADEVVLNLIPHIGSEVHVSRALPSVFDGVTFAPTNGVKTINLGMWLSENEHSYEAYSLGMDNMKCIYDISVNPPSWTFHYGVTPHYILSVKPIDTGHDDLYLYAYAPYNAEAVSPEVVPVKSGDDELIYTQPIHSKSKKSGETIDIPLNFMHAQACIEFRIVPARQHYNIELNGLTINDTNMENQIIPLSGKFNTVTGSYIDESLQYCDMLELSQMSIKLPQYTSSMTPIKVYVPIIPFKGYEDNRFEVEFNFSSVKCTIPLSTINKDENGCMEFKQGYKYVYNLVLDNETLYKSGALETKWSDGPITNFDI